MAVKRTKEGKQTSFTGQRTCGQLKENALYSKAGKQVSLAGLHQQNKDGNLTVEQQIFIQGMLYQYNQNAWYTVDGQQPSVTGQYQNQFEYKDGSLSVEQQIFIQGMSYQNNYELWFWQNYYATNYGQYLPCQTEMPSDEIPPSYQDESPRNLC